MAAAGSRHAAVVLVVVGLLLLATVAVPEEQDGTGMCGKDDKPDEPGCIKGEPKEGDPELKKQLVDACGIDPMKLGTGPKWKALLDDSSYQVQLGNEFKAQIQLRELLSQYGDMPEPAKAVAYHNLGLVAMKREKFADAIQSLKEALKYKDDFAEAHALLAYAYVSKAKSVAGKEPATAARLYADAVAAQEAAVAKAPGNVEQQVRLAEYLLNVPMKAVDALDIMRRVVDQDEENVHTLHVYAQTQEATGAVYQAKQTVDKLLRVYSSVRLSQAGNVSTDTEDGGRGEAEYVAYGGALLMKMGRMKEAAAELERAVLLSKGRDAMALTHLAKCKERLGNDKEARALLERALEVDGGYSMAHYELGRLKMAGEDWQGAMGHFQRAYRANAGMHDAFCNVMYIKRQVCDWTRWKGMMSQFRGVLEAQLRNDQLPCLLPFHLLAFNLSTDTQKRATERVSSELYRRTATYVHNVMMEPSAEGARERKRLEGLQCDGPAAEEAGACVWAPASRRQPRRGGKLRIGFVSSNLNNHAVGNLVQAVFGEMDRRRFHVTAYALARRVRSDDRTQQRIASEVDSYVDISTMGVYEAAARVRADNIHVLVNLNGHTLHSRNELFALHPAPVQLMFNGFYFTFGGAGVDHLATDAVASPPQQAHLYTEKLVYLPVPFAVSDYLFTRPEVFGNEQRRAKFVFSEGGVQKSSIQIGDGNTVFASFNALYKLEPDVFAVWMRILKRVPRSILWLQRVGRDGQLAAQNLRREAKAAGVDPRRLVFTERVQKEQHLVVKGMADVFLDNPLFNGHTTGIDALYAGVPVVTVAGESMGQRVGASMLQGLGLKELVAANLEEYEELAVQMAHNATYLEYVRRHLRQQRTESTLFNTSRWVKGWQTAVRLTYEAWHGQCMRGCWLDRAEDMDKCMRACTVPRRRMHVVVAGAGASGGTTQTRTHQR